MKTLLRLSLWLMLIPLTAVGQDKAAQSSTPPTVQPPAAEEAATPTNFTSAKGFVLEDGTPVRIRLNRTISSALAGVAMGVKRGEGIAGPMRKAAVFPPLVAHLLVVGEETGRLDQMFVRLADIYENDTRAAIRRFTSVFEPAVILVMGIVVGALILSMLLAITSINDVAV